MRRETELFFYSVVKENRSVFDLFNADYTFVNERLARHYGIPGVLGATFQRSRIRTTRAVEFLATAACWCKPPSAIARRRCCAANG
jgi:hypothetical protein